MLQHYGCQTLYKQCLSEWRLFGVLFVLRAAVHSPSFQHHHPRHHRLNSLSNTYNHPASNPSPLVRCGLKKQCPSKCRTNPTHSRPSPFQRDVGGSFLPLDGEIGEGEPQGGTHGVGGLSGASRTKSTTNVVVSFLPFLFRWLLILLHPNRQDEPTAVTTDNL
jgi:hypothetical protein